MKHIRIIYIAVLLLWLAFIFSNSAVNAADSTEQSDGFIAAVQSFLASLGLEFDLDSHYMRKFAHFAEFCILGIIAGCFCPTFKKNPKNVFLPALFFGMTVALCDETVQLFHPGRSGQISDVWLDFSAYFVGAAAVCAVVLLILRKREK